MTYDPDLARLGVYDARAPRYTSYPTAVHFHNDVGSDFTRQQLQNLPIDKPISIYIHIPFCERLCWFCACRTQGTKNSSAIESYLDVLIEEIKLIAQLLPTGIRVGKVHWGGGTPTILPPKQIRKLSKALKSSIIFEDNHEFSVEIDPTLVSQEKIRALAEIGMTRASIGVQDFSPRVQNSIGRRQSIEITKTCIDMLRAAGVHSLNMDILYGLPHQTIKSVSKTINTVQSLSPDRIALYGYAHVPWMAKRQKLIEENALPNGENRRALFNTMAEILEESGYSSIGIDHFAKPTDSMCIAAQIGNLRRNFQGYTTDDLDTLIGIGASAISKYPHGFTQNTLKSSEYSVAIKNGELGSFRGIETTHNDRMIARLIEMIMCDFKVNFEELKCNFNLNIEALTAPFLSLQKDFGKFICFNEHGFEIIKYERELARIIAKTFDKYDDRSTNRYSNVS